MSTARAWGRAPGGGATWRHGGVNGRPHKVITLISPEDGYAEDGGGEGFLERVWWYALRVCRTGCSVWAT